jgi:LPXTG-motif cell wall-anchored protein
MQERTSYWRRTALGVGSIVAGGLIVVAAVPGSAGAAGDQVVSTTSTSVVTGGNPTCGDFGFDVEFKIDDQPEEGETYSDAELGIEVTITDVSDTNPMTFSFTSNIAVSAVFVKSGNGGILYTFDPPTTVGTNLASPNDSISHVSFCWNEDTTTTTEKETTSTTAKDTTTSTTAKDTTTSTTARETTTTMEGATTTAGQASTTVAAAVTPTTRPSGGLPRTGTNTVPLIALAALLVGGGTALVAATRRSRSS